MQKFGLNRDKLMKRTLFYSIIFICMPVGILITAGLRRESTYQGKSALAWFENMKMSQQSPNLDALKQMGKSAIPVLQMELKSEKVGYRIKSAWALGQIGVIARDATPDLIQALKDQNMIVRINAIKSLMVIDMFEPELVSQLIARLDDSDLGVDNSAADALIKIEQEQKKGRVTFVTNDFDCAMAFLNSPSIHVRLIGLNRLIKLSTSDERVVTTMKSLLQDKSLPIRERAENFFLNTNFDLSR